MRLHTLKLRFRRQWRQRVARTEDLSHRLGEQLDNNFLGRLGRIRLVWRFMLGWVLLFVLLAGCLVAQLAALRGYYQVQQPVPGGMYSEGIEGNFTTASPLYAVSDVDTSVSKLLFAGLFTYDGHNQLAGDLADRWSVNGDGMVYTVHLRPNLTWQDGQPLTAADVVFTYQTIQNPDAQSPLFSSWQGVKVAALDKQTVTFTLPNPLSSFPYSLTNGIVPQHLLASVNVVDLRSAGFNTDHPVGAGPFSWSSVGESGEGPTAEEQIILVPFAQYWAGAPRLSSFSIDAFADRAAMITAYQNNEVGAMVGLDSVPSSVAHDTSSHIYNLMLTAGTYVFFNTTSPLLSDAKIRQALAEGSNRSAIIQHLGYVAIPVDEPLLQGQLGYDPTYAQATDKLAQAAALLDADGWHVGPGGIRTKNGRSLSFTLTAIAGGEYASVAKLLSTQWKALGVDVQVDLQQPDDFQSTLAPSEPRAYDAVLYGVSVGVDPDVFVYWDSSQASPLSASRLNFSNYKSAAADAALEAGRTRQDPSLRSVKYRAFLQAWQQDAPALGLYQPRLLYISHVPVYGLGGSQINTDADRFNDVQNWMIHVGWVTR